MPTSIVTSPYSPFKRKVAVLIFVTLLVLLAGSAVLIAFQLNPFNLVNSIRSGAYTTDSEVRVVNMGVCPSRCRTINDVQTIKVYENISDRTLCDNLQGTFRFVEQYQLPENMQKTTSGQPRGICQRR